jgi:hypothetical protein
MCSGGVEILLLERQLHHCGGDKQPAPGGEESLGEPHACVQIKNINIKL